MIAMAATGRLFHQTQQVVHFGKGHLATRLDAVATGEGGAEVDQEVLEGILRRDVIRPIGFQAAQKIMQKLQ